MLLLKRHLVELVRAGKKRQTLRFWRGRMVRVGQVTYTPGLGRVRVTGVDELAGVAALTDEDARLDGFADKAALLGELERIYGTTRPAGRRLFRVQFQWPVEETPAPAEEKAGKNASRRMDDAQRELLKRFVVDRQRGV